MNIYISSLFDAFNTAACLIVVLRLWQSHRQNSSVLVKDFFYFYLLFTIFFFFLALPVVFNNNLRIVQTFFVVGHLILYLALSYFTKILFELIVWRKFLLPLQLVLVATGVTVFIISLQTFDQARVWEVDWGAYKFIAFSHGGASWIRTLIGLLGGFSGLFFALILSFRGLRLEDLFLRRRALYLAAGTFVLGLAAVFAFTFSIFAFYSFGIVLTAEVLAISGLLIMMKGIFYEREI